MSRILSAEASGTTQERLPVFVLITPARNEEAYIEQTIRSVVAQTVRPLRWIIVSDGSTDGTDDIVSRYAEVHDWITLVRLPRRSGRHFAGKVDAFNAGYARLADLEYDVIGNLDADISVPPDYFAFLLDRFHQTPELGVAGTPFVEAGFQYDYNFVSIEHVSGACQLFRRACFEDIGGYRPLREGGVDWVAVTTARMRGWKTRTFTGRTCRHHRRIGTSVGGIAKAKFNVGQRDYCLGSHPLWEVFRAVYWLTLKPYVLAGSLIWLGYVWAWLSRRPRPISPELVAFRRAEQMRRLHAALLRPLRRVYRIVTGRLLKKWAPSSVKKAIWDDEFARGQWDYLDHTVDDPVYGALAKYARNGRLLDLGCGSSNTGNELEAASYSSYTGVDISERAIGKAVARATQAGREHKNRYVCADISAYVPTEQYDIILFRESIFYIPLRRIRRVLQRYSGHLAPGGVFVVRMCDHRKYDSIVRLIERHHEAVETSIVPAGDIILVFR